MTTDTVVDFDSAQDNLAASLPGYERREKQASLAHKVESQIRGDGASRHALLQASTGTGKSLAYLIPAILSGKKVVVSTATKALQDQIANKDLPFLAEHLGVSFTHSILKGRSNYLCQAELARLGEDDPALAAKITRKLDELSTDGHGQSFPAGLYAEETDLDVTPVEFRPASASSPRQTPRLLRWLWSTTLSSAPTSGSMRSRAARLRCSVTTRCSSWTRRTN